MDRIRRFIAVLLGWLTIADYAIPNPATNAALASELPGDLTLHCEGNIGDSGSDSGTAGGASGNPSDSGGGGSGGISIPGFVDDLEPLADYVDILTSFAKAPIEFLRARAIPPVIGAIFGFTFDLADIVAQPFDTVLGSLALLSESVSKATAAISDPIADALSIGSELVLSVTAPLGPLQPFVATALTLVMAYGLLILSIRLLRALADSIPIVSGVETFLFG